MKDVQIAVEMLEEAVEKRFPGDPMELVNDGTAEEIRDIAENVDSFEDIDFDEYIDELLNRIGYVEREWKIYGLPGQTQKYSFERSERYDWSKPGKVRIVEVDNADKTGTNEYSVLRIIRPTWGECEDEMNGQISDGLFENYKVGKIEEIDG